MGDLGPVTARTSAVAILTWRGEEQTRACLNSVLGAGGWSGRTVVVDNGSGTGEGERLAAEFGVETILMTANRGVPGGYNGAIEWARRNGLTHVLLANNDLEFGDDGIVLKLLALGAGDVAAVGPIIRSRERAITSAGGRLRQWVGHVQRTKVPRANEAYEVDALEGACLLISIDAACRIGGLEPEFFLYWEETDWCARARSVGLRLLVDPTVSVTHVGIGSGNRRQTRRYALRNSLLFVRRNIHGVPGLTAGLAWWFGKVPFFVARRLSERANPIGVLQDAAWAISFHLRDISRRGWELPASGPNLCQ